MKKIDSLQNLNIKYNNADYATQNAQRIHTIIMFKILLEMASKLKKAKKIPDLKENYLILNFSKHK